MSPPPPEPAVSYALALPCDFPVMWRLKSKVGFWVHDLLAPPSVISVISDGYRLPFTSQPRPFRRPNHPSARLHATFVDAEVARLLAVSAILEVAQPPAGICALGVESSRDTLRLIHDERPLSPYLFAPKFRYESVSTARHLLRERDLLVQFDLSKAYHHVRVWSGHWGWLGFEWRGRFYVSMVMPFGVLSAPFAFTKVTRPIARYLRSRGVRLVLMLDDGLVIVAPSDVGQVALVRATLDAAGFLVNEAKSSWSPSPRTEAYLGFTIDVETGRLGIKVSRVVKLATRLRALRRRTQPTRRQVASIAGQLASMSVVLGVVVRLRTRSLYELVGDIQDRRGWDRRVEWTPHAWSEVKFWRRFVASTAMSVDTDLWPVDSVPTLTLSTDASDRALGMVLTPFVAPDLPSYASSVDSGHVVGPVVGSRMTSFLPLTEEEMVTSSTVRELRALSVALASFPAQLQSRVVLWRVDNAAAAIIVLKGSRRSHLQRIAVEIAAMTRDLNVHLLPLWVPRELNVEADWWSRQVDRGDFSLAPATFRRVTLAWHVYPVIDLFADCFNAHCRLFFSGRPVPGSAGVDALSLPWPTGVPLYAFPPIPTLGALLRRLILGPPVVMMLVLPVWSSQSWWPLLAPDGVHSVAQVRRWWRLHRADLVAGPSGPPLFLQRTDWRFDFVALLWDSTESAHSLGRFCRHRFQGRPCRTCGPPLPPS